METATERMIQDISDQAELGWNDRTMLELLCEYVESQQNPDAVDKFFSRKAREEREV